MSEAGSKGRACSDDNASKTIFRDALTRIISGSGKDIVSCLQHRYFSVIYANKISKNYLGFVLTCRVVSNIYISH